MKKIKKLLAMIMAMTMVLGLGLTSFAATNSTITINNAGNGSFKAVRVVEPNTGTDTGWEIVIDYQREFLDAFSEDSTQDIIKGMIAAANPNLVGSHEDAVAISRFDSKYQDALEAVLARIDMTSGTAVAVDGVAQIDVSDGESTAGVWVIKGEEEGFNYSPMAAYIDFADGTTNAINAKKAPDDIDKDNTDEDGVIEVGQEIEYTISTRVPYIPTSDTNRHYVVNDTITGATYALYQNPDDPSDSNNGKVEVTVTVSESLAEGAESHSWTHYVEAVGNSFSVDISGSILRDETGEMNKYQNWYLTISYSAVATGTVVENEANIDDGTGTGDPDYGSDGSVLISGTATLHKTGVDEDATGLEGAEFVLEKEITTQIPGGETTKSYKYGVFTTVYDEDGTTVLSYNLDHWVDTIEAATRLVTDADGHITVKGLDPKQTYSFKEVKAPDGYSINSDNAEITWDNLPNKGEITAETTVTGIANMTDTKLASLPGTGGIGTTIFTIGGCAIMIAAAALYFVNRRKSEEN